MCLFLRDIILEVYPGMFLNVASVIKCNINLADMQINLLFVYANKIIFKPKPFGFMAVMSFIEQTIDLFIY